MKSKEFGGFKGSLAKLKRANIHRLDLDIKIRQFLSSNPYEIIFYEESPEGFYPFRIKHNHPLPDFIPCVLGDFMHNLRSALDHLAIDLVLFNGRGTSDISFPSADNSDDFNAILDNNAISKAGKYAVDKIRCLETYYGGKGHDPSTPRNRCHGQTLQYFRNG